MDRKVFRQYLDIVGDQNLAQVKHLQHGGSIVVADAVAFQDILGSSDLPGEPALAKGCVEGQHVGQVAWLTAAAALILLHTLCDGLHFSLLTIRTCFFTHTEEMEMGLEY